ncbi:MAG: type II toxin-antitoxin system VapC family toxin [Nitrospirae bacterium]|nr:MAG: type II toxin-antitoxin system VapC family toxin [Nitrospirota bacterium]
MCMQGPPAKVIFDTSVYIPFINNGVSHPAFEFSGGNPIIYMSAVVMEELYAGAFDTESLRLLDKMQATFRRVGRLTVPDAEDWMHAGKTIAKLGKKYGFDGTYLHKLTNDVLIALSARRIGALVVTHNIKDFQRIREFAVFKLYLN